MTGGMVPLPAAYAILPHSGSWAALISGQALEKHHRGGMQESKGCGPGRLRGLACGHWSQPCTERKSSREPNVQTALKYSNFQNLGVWLLGMRKRKTGGTASSSGADVFLDLALLCECLLLAQSSTCKA